MRKLLLFLFISCHLVAQIQLETQVKTLCPLGGIPVATAGARFVCITNFNFQSTGGLLVPTSGTIGSAYFGTVTLGNLSNTNKGVNIADSANIAAAIGQSTLNNVGLLWNYNANPASAFATLYTFGNSNYISYQALYHRFTNRVETPNGINIGDGTLIAKHLSATASLNAAAPGTVPGCSADLTITVTGAAVGDTVTVGTPVTLPASFMIHAWVSAINTVSIRWCQLAGAAADPDGVGGTYRTDVWQH